MSDITGQAFTTESPVAEHAHVSFNNFVPNQTKMADSDAALATDSTEALNGGAVQPETDAVNDEHPEPPIEPIRKRTFSHLESDDEYEIWRIPKGHPALRDPTEIPLKAVKEPENTPCVIWAKMDTGADVNVVAIKAVQRLGLESTIYANPNGSEHMYEAAGNHFTASQCVKLSFEAGRSKFTYTDVEFWIPDLHEGDTDTDGIPDVLLGWPFIREKHMVMVDPEFIYEPDPDLEVLAKRSEDELMDEVPRKKVMPTKVIKHSQVSSSKYGR